MTTYDIMLTTYEFRVYGLISEDAEVPLYWTEKFQHILDDLTFDQAKKLWLAQNPDFTEEVVAIYNTTKMHYCHYHGHYYS